MAFLIFKNNQSNIENTLIRIAEDQQELNAILSTVNDYKLIEITQEKFNDVKINKSPVIKYVDNDVIYNQNQPSSGHFRNSKDLKIILDPIKNNIQFFLDSNKNSLLFDKWNNYLNFLNNLNLESLNYPIESSFEEYLSKNNIFFLNPLQLP
jgi:hypothetical protein